MMTGLIISARDVINAEMVNAVLAADRSAAAEQLRDDFLREDGKSLEEILEQLIPIFANASMPIAMSGLPV